MSVKTTQWIIPGMLAGVLLGGFLGWQAPQLMRTIGFLGDLFINALTFMVFPLLFTSIAVGVYQLGSRQKIYRVTGNLLLYFLALGIIAALIGLAAGLLLQPGTNSAIVFTDLHSDWSPLSVVLVPGWLVVGTILSALLFGGALTAFGSRARVVSNVLSQAGQAILKGVGALMIVAPLGLFSVVGSLLAGDRYAAASMSSALTAGQSTLGPILNGAGQYLMATVLGLFVLAVIVLPIVAKVLGKQSVLQLVRAILPAAATSFAASSSLAALPFTYRALSDNRQIDGRAGAAALPLGVVLNVGATTLCAVTATIFIAQASGVQLSLIQYILIPVVPLFLAVGTVGLPYPLLSIMLAQIAILGFPAGAAGALAMILVVDWLVDRCRSAVNVWSDSIGTAVIAQSFEFKTARTPNSGAKERSTDRPARTPSRGRADRSTPDRHRPGSREPRRSRDQRSEDRRPRERKPASRTSGRSTRKPVDSDQRKTPTRRQSSTLGGQPEASPFTVTGEQTPRLDVDVTPPAVPAKKEPDVPGKSSSEDSHAENGSGFSARESRSYAGRSRKQSMAVGEKEALTESKKELPLQITNGRLSPDTIARELKKVSAQLNPPEPNHSEDEPNMLTHSNDERQSEDSAPAPEVSPLLVTVPTGQFDSDKDSDEAEDRSDANETSSPVPEPALVGGHEKQEADEDATAEPSKTPAPIQYGRTRTRRGDRSPRNEEQTPNGDDEEHKVGDGFSSEKITSFGRTKKRRVRK